MSPLKIELLLRLYARANPFEGYRPEQITAPAVNQAFADFKRLGLTHEWVSNTTPNLLEAVNSARDRLTPKGMELVKALMNVTALGDTPPINRVEGGSGAPLLLGTIKCEELGTFEVYQHPTKQEYSMWHAETDLNAYGFTLLSSLFKAHGL